MTQQESGKPRSPNPFEAAPEVAAAMAGSLPLRKRRMRRVNVSTSARRSLMSAGLASPTLPRTQPLRPRSPTRRAAQTSERSRVHNYVSSERVVGDGFLRLRQDQSMTVGLALHPVHAGT